MEKIRNIIRTTTSGKLLIEYTREDGMERKIWAEPFETVPLDFHKETFMIKDILDGRPKKLYFDRVKSIQKK